MNPRERYLATLLFEKPDRVPWMPGHGRESTRRNWHQQGLTPDVTDYHAYIQHQLGIESCRSNMPVIDPGINFTMIPEFEEKIIEERPDSRVVQDWKGNICEIGKAFDPSYLRGAPDFVTRSWLKLPVESRDDWPAMAHRYDPNDPARFPEDFAQRCAKLKDRDYPSVLGFSGPFWQLREWVGFEGLCMLFLDDPGFARQMIEHWQNFIASMLERIFEHYVPDTVTFNEDMAYKEKPMIGPDMCRRFLLPCWETWVNQCQSVGVPIIEIDSDGHVGELIPVWIEAGVNCNSPQEVAAGNDLPAYRKAYGRKMAYRGGVDKRKMAKGGKAIRDEIQRVKPTIDAGGFIPGCDHGVPSDVSWPNFVEYCRLLANATGWL